MVLFLSFRFSGGGGVDRGGPMTQFSTRRTRRCPPPETDFGEQCTPGSWKNKVRTYNIFPTLTITQIILTRNTEKLILMPGIMNYVCLDHFLCFENCLLPELCLYFHVVL